MEQYRSRADLGLEQGIASLIPEDLPGFAEMDGGEHIGADMSIEKGAIAMDQEALANSGIGGLGA